MIYLFLCILSSTFILLLFKYMDRRGIDGFQAIVVNYLAATVLGYFTTGPAGFRSQEPDQPALFLALIIGTIFIIVFFLIARSTSHAGVSTTSVATKMSVIIPVLFSILRYQEGLDWKKILGVIIALIALFLTIYKKEANRRDPKSWILPVTIFFGTGIVDSIIKFSQAEHIAVDDVAYFNTIVFATSFIIGLTVFLLSFKKQVRKFKPAVLWAGSLLGFANFGALYFLISALNSSGINSSVLFPLNNIGVVVFSVIFAVILFREKISAINLAGILAAVAAVILLIDF